MIARTIILHHKSPVFSVHLSSCVHRSTESAEASDAKWWIVVQSANLWINQEFEKELVFASTIDVNVGCRCVNKVACRWWTKA
jgi:hypothetical protein